MDPAIVEFFSSLTNAVWPWGGLGLVLMSALRLMRLPVFQSFLPSFMLWKNWPLWFKVAFPFALAVAGTILPAAAMHQMSFEVLKTALMAGAAAVAMHHGTKLAGSKMTAKAIAANPNYIPGLIRRSFSPILPVDKKLLMKSLLRSVK
jgi:hypothetical protein